MAGRTLEDWLAYQQRVHPRAMDFTLERIQAVLARLGLDRPRVPVISVAGTNGKGSVTALLEALLRAGGRRTGLYTSPHLQRYTERIRLDGREIDAAALPPIFERIERARGEITLTYFEYATAAALCAFADARPEVLVLEVGLGGRFDAVNAIDAEVAVVTSIGLDHCEYLGTTLADIGREKAGIFRRDRPAIYGSRSMPATIAVAATRCGARLERLGAEFDYRIDAERWHWQRGTERLADLPPPALIGPVQYANAATALAALAAAGLLPGREAIDHGLRGVRLAGRFQVVPGSVPWIFDVAHNPDGAAALAAALREHPVAGRTLVVAGVLADKDAGAIGRELAGALGARDLVGVVTLTGERGRSAAELEAAFAPALGRVLTTADSVAAGCAWAEHLAEPGDRVLVFGSFQTVGPALEWHRLYCGRPR